MEDSLQKFVTSIRKKYRERLMNRERQWPPCHSSELVRLELMGREKGDVSIQRGQCLQQEGQYRVMVTCMDEIFECNPADMQRGRNSARAKYGGRAKRTPLAYADLFKVESGERPVRKVLVEGDAGIGKTTLCIAVSEDWANEKLFKQFKLVLLLPLRMKAVASAGSLPELLKLLHSSPDLCKAVARYLEIEEGERVLLIADGWDELSEFEQREASFLHQLLFQQFPLMSVIVTSRPSASASLHQLPCIDRFVEVCGFSIEHIAQYIQSEFASDQEKAGRLLEHLKNNPLIESVCSVPLNCAIVCHLWRTLEEALPTTMTELYTKIILNFVLRNIRKTDTYMSVMSVSSFGALPADLQQSWWLLCKFAFLALERDQLVFTQEELQAFFPEGLALDERILCFGILQRAESILDIGYGVSFHFLHLTFQEYLAALHLAKQPLDIQLSFFQSRQGSNRFTRSFNHFATVKKLCFGILSRAVSIDKNLFFNQILTCIFTQDILFVCHCMFEAHSALINSKMTRCSRNHFSNLLHIGNIGGYICNAYDCAAVLYVLANCNMQEYAGIRINFGHVSCGIGENQLIQLLPILTDKKDKIQVTDLNLRGSRLTVSGLQALRSAIWDDLLTKLEMLNLRDSLTSDADANIVWLTNLVEALSNHCSLLRGLNLSENGLCALSLARILDATFTLGKVEVLNLSDNPLGLKGTKVVSRMLSNSHCQVLQLNLSRCCLTAAGGSVPDANPMNLAVFNVAVGQQLYEMPQNSYIVCLCLDGNNFTEEGIHILAGFMHLCPCLMHLYTCDCGITSGDLVWLLDKLTEFVSSCASLCSRLRFWFLCDNQIDDRGVSALLDLQPSLFPDVRYLDPGIYLDNNPVSSEMMERLKIQLQPRHQLVIISTSHQLPSGLWSFSTLVELETINLVTFVSSRHTQPPPPSIPSSTCPRPLHDNIPPQSPVSVPTAPMSSLTRSIEHQALQPTSPTFAENLSIRQAVLSGSTSGQNSVSTHPIAIDEQPREQEREESTIADVEHHFVDMIKWVDENGEKKELRIYSKIAHRWRQIATRLGFELGEIESVEENHHRNNSRITAVLRRWFENARNLSNASRYPKSWQGLINLLDDAELGEVAEELRRALPSQRNSVRGNLS